MKIRHLHASDLRALARLATDATLEVTDLVERVHAGIARPRLRHASGATTGVSGLVYRTVRSVTRTAGRTTDAVLGQVVPLFGHAHSSPAREAVLAALNGVIGDYLTLTGNALAIPMQFRLGGQRLVPGDIPEAGGKLLVLVHGLCMNDLQWRYNGHSHGAALARDLGYSPVYLHYNSGRHIADNGRHFAQCLEALLARWPTPVEEVVIVGHSMGGLVARSACHYGTEAGHAWTARLRALVFLGTPHHGAPLERLGNWIETVLRKTPYAAPFARLGMLRSAGITDLRYGTLLEHGHEIADRFQRGPDARQPLPLPEHVACYAVAGKLHARFTGDGLVPLSSAFGEHDDPRHRLAFPESHKWVAEGVGHLDLLGDAGVYERIREWLA